MVKKIIAIIVGLFCFGFTCGTLGSKIVKNINEGKPAKYVFLFIGDGMGHAQAFLSESYLAYKDSGKFGGSQLLFTQFPDLGTCFTHSASSRVTDSAAAGTAIATGHKTHNGWLGMDADGNNVYSMAVDFHNMGYNVGVYSSVPVNHATPAAFYAHNNHRSDYYNISKQIPEGGFEFYGGANFLEFEGPEGEPNTEEYLESNGYQVAFGQAEFDQIKDSEHVVLLAEPRSVEATEYVSDATEAPQTMLLADMTRNALEFLGDEKPFFIMCEGGEIDYMCHDDKTMPTVEATLKFNDAIQVAYDFYLKHPKQTLIVVTADHETGGLTLGAEPLSYAIDWATMEQQWEESGHQNTLSPEENKALNESCGFGWTTTHHTGAPVPIYAIGKGSDKFRSRMDNTDIINKILCR